MLKIHQERKSEDSSEVVVNENQKKYVGANEEKVWESRRSVRYFQGGFVQMGRECMWSKKLIDLKCQNQIKSQSITCQQAIHERDEDSS